jgi:hypothetical protein
MTPAGYTLLASLGWGTVGLGLFIFGKKQHSTIPLFGGIALIGISYFISDALWMSAAAITIILTIIFLKRQGY